MYNEYEMHGMTDEKIRTAHFSQVNIYYMTRTQINDTFLFQNRVKVVGDVSEK